MDNIICPRCGEKLVICNRITDRDWSKQKSFYASHKINKRCQAQWGIYYYPSKETLIDAFKKRGCFE